MGEMRLVVLRRHWCGECRIGGWLILTCQFGQHSAMAGFFGFGGFPSFGTVGGGYYGRPVMSPVASVGMPGPGSIYGSMPSVPSVFSQTPSRVIIPRARSPFCLPFACSRDAMMMRRDISVHIMCIAVTGSPLPKRCVLCYHSVLGPILGLDLLFDGTSSRG